MTRRTPRPLRPAGRGLSRIALAGALLGPLLGGCTRPAKPVELVAYEHRIRANYKSTLEVRQPKLLEKSRVAHRKAISAWRREDKDGAIHYTRLADIYWRTAQALSHSKDLADAAVAYRRQAAQAAESKALAEERLAGVERDIRRLERLQRMQTELVEATRTARQERQASAARQRIDAAMAALRKAEDLDAERHAPGPLNKARQSLQNAFDAFNAGRYREATQAADLTQADAAAASAIAAPLHGAEAEQRAVDAELREMLESAAGAPWADARIERRGLVVGLRELFAPNKSTLKTSIRLDPFSRLAKAHPRYRVVVEGHTDNRGSSEVNLRLSDARANAVAKQLQEAGVAAERLTTVGKGDAEPVADNATAAGRALNRRVEVIFVRPTIQSPTPGAAAPGTGAPPAP